MANDSSTNGQHEHATIEVNGVTRHTSDTENGLKSELLQNGGIQRIENVLTQRLDMAGWSQDLREYVDRLLRTGTATTYTELRDIIIANIRSNGAETVDCADGTPAPNLGIPHDAAVDAAEVIKREVREVMKPPK